MNDRQRVIADATVPIMKKYREGRIATENLIDVIKISIGDKIGDATEDEIVAALEHNASQHLRDVALKEMLERIVARLDPPPLKYDTVHNILRRAVEAGDEEAISLVESDGIDALLTNTEPRSG